MLRAYVELARSGYRRYAAYPSATWAGVFTNTLFGFMRAYILLALFEHGSSFGGYDARETVTYTWVTQGLVATIFIWGWTDVAIRIRTGEIAVDLARPINPQVAGLAFDLGRGLYHAIFRGIPPFLVGAAVFSLLIPISALQWLAFACSLALAVAVSFSFRFLYNLAAFWLLDHRGVMILSMNLAHILSGFIIPLAFFPDGLRTLAYATPFPSMVQIPADIFVGETTGIHVMGALAQQAFWLAALLAAGHFTFALGARRVVVQGG